MLKILNSISNDNKELFERALDIRKSEWGNTVTYSRKVFVPLTNMCRDTCSYCTFVKHPNSKLAKILNPDEVMKIVDLGEKSGCKEVLLSLGEKPELRYLKAKNELNKLGFSSMTDYLVFICKMILKNSSLLPHVNAGTLTKEEINKLKPVTASMGMMLENTSRRLTKKGMPHYACPDKVPIQRIRTMDNMGILKIPFTTGILVGIGETWQERIETLQAIQNSHLKFGHIQEVIVQNFVPKQDIKMKFYPKPKHNDFLKTIALARLILSPDISIQAPPNLSLEHPEYLKVGLNDWGGISPITKDFINPENKWPIIKDLNNASKLMGYSLKERLTVYPKFQNEKDGFLHQHIRTKMELLSCDNGLAKEQYIQ